VVREQTIKLAVEEPTLSLRELAVRFTDMENYFVSEASVYRLLKGNDLIASPAFIVMKAANVRRREPRPYDTELCKERNLIERYFSITLRRLFHQAALAGTLRLLRSNSFTASQPATTSSSSPS
jgi:hypothetical protein